MKFNDLTDAQKKLMAEHYPDYMAEHYPDYMAEHYPADSGLPDYTVKFIEGF